MSRASPARTPYMHLRGASYYFRYVLPSALAAQIDRKAVKISLRIAYIRLSCARAAGAFGASGDGSAPWFGSEWGGNEWTS